MWRRWRRWEKKKGKGNPQLRFFSTSSQNFESPPTLIKPLFDQAYSHQIQSRTGLFGIKDLSSPVGWKLVTQKCLHGSSELVNEIIKKTKDGSPSYQVLDLLDSLSSLLCESIDPAELCRNIHPEESFRNAAQEAFFSLQDFTNQLNTNTELHQAAKYVVEHSDGVTREGMEVASKLKEECELNGIHLEKKKRNLVIQLQNEISAVAGQFMHESNTISEPIRIPLVSLASLPYSVKQQLTKKGNEALILPDSEIAESILRLVPSGEIRKLVYVQGNRSLQSNLVLLEKLRDLKHRLACLIGFPSYAHMMINPTTRVASSPEQMQEFLEDLAHRLTPKAKEELAILQKEKMALEKDSIINDWDRLFYTELAKKRLSKIDEQVDMMEYFTLGNCVQGLNIIVYNLFGCYLQLVPLEQGEGWHPSVRKVQLFHPTQGVLGYIYMDLFPRVGKSQQCATFAINFTVTRKPSSVPKVALVCNFNIRDREDALGTPPLLSHHEAETLFHEFGHCLSGIFSRTEYQHLSGTRSALDFMETPSTLMEFYMWDYRVVQKFAHHYQTGEVLPSSVLEEFRTGKTMFSAINTHQQVIYSLFDLALHGPPTTNAKTSTQIFEELQNKYSLIPYVPGTHWHTKFGHIVSGYDAGYYSYLYGRVFSSDLWFKCFAADPLNRAVGEKYRQHILSKGGSEHPKKMLYAMLDRDPTPDAFLKYLQGKI